MTWHSAFLKAFLSDSERYVIIRNCSRQYLSLERRHLPEGNQRNEGSIPFTRFRPLVPHGLPPWLKLLRTRPRAGSALNHGAASEAQLHRGGNPIGLASEAALQACPICRGDAVIVLGAFIRVCSCPFVVTIRVHSWCQFDTGTNSGYCNSALRWAERFFNGCF